PGRPRREGRRPSVAGAMLGRCRCRSPGLSSTVLVNVWQRRAPSRTRTTPSSRTCWARTTLPWPPVKGRLRSRGYAVTGRLKTAGTLIDKLRREQGMKLKGVQDVAGARIVVRGTREGQDDAVADVVSTFSYSDKPPRVRDRR